jgi:hypothetical protein
MAAQIDGSTGISHFWRVDTVFCDSTAEKLIEMTGCDRPCDCGCCDEEDDEEDDEDEVGYFQLDAFYPAATQQVRFEARVTATIEECGGKVIDTVPTGDGERRITASFTRRSDIEQAREALSFVRTELYRLGPDGPDDLDDISDDFQDGFDCGWEEGREAMLAQARAVIKAGASAGE